MYEYMHVVHISLLYSYKRTYTRINKLTNIQYTRVYAIAELQGMEYVGLHVEVD